KPGSTEVDCSQPNAECDSSTSGGKIGLKPKIPQILLDCKNPLIKCSLPEVDSEPIDDGKCEGQGIGQDIPKTPTCKGADCVKQFEEQRCRLNPEAVGCKETVLKTAEECEEDPSAKGCEIFKMLTIDKNLLCKASPLAPGCRLFCAANPGDLSCKSE
ncbi:MAG TPA: hypothetical protein VE954_19420, partial [Oligoflexus sp.]|uniref:hypothetical protein n=1 Tax=Oligoflexus sp. TaxID=1971216 RepID=UPI002D6A2B36